MDGDPSTTPPRPALEDNLLVPQRPPKRRLCTDGLTASMVKKRVRAKKQRDSSPPRRLVPLRRAGPYLIGPTLGHSPVPIVVQCLARKEGTDDFFTLKILSLKQDLKQESQEDRQGKMLLHTEYSLLSLLHGLDGVVHHHGLFKDEGLEEHVLGHGQTQFTGRLKPRLVLVLDCLVDHEFSAHYKNFINLQHYVIKEKKLTEREAIIIFFDIVRVVERLHQRNIVHRDLKLGNMVLNKRTRRVTITNFCLGKHLISENDLLTNQRGSPAYISPDVLSDRPYLGKPSDMWAMGVVLYTMLYGRFPFYDSAPHELFRKIKSADYALPKDGRVSDDTSNLIRRLLVLDPAKRMTASQVLDNLRSFIATWQSMTFLGTPSQVVPEIDNDKTEDTKASSFKPVGTSDLENILRLQSDGGEIMPVAVKMSSIPARAPGVAPRIRNLNRDAQPLRPQEVMQLRHLLQ
ncbi:hypothetical protein CAPTEDRAFT_226259 [Capitella teleta]|uniref:Serine/threonine-protein kinase 40 n=1 Tax=Capitella teleta TaxID=283909 RepID=R7TWR6_CAPTE|nr:hypothetical protein CAPTEDRAFT_226259 [Capitella teleta]|eukprot:ELT95415.1 hypothetical protein CAPTEDRAFT_226259 [Capitella teleta]